LDIYGEVVVSLGSVPQGQGHETTAAQVVAEVLPFTSTDPRFAEYLVTYNEQRKKTPQEEIRELVAITDPAAAYAKLIVGVLSTLLAAARDDGVPVRLDVTAGLGRLFKLAKSTAARQDEVKAFDRAQLALFLSTSERTVPRLAPLFLLMARTGLRLGEGLALQWDDFDLPSRTLHVARNLSGGRIGTPKSGAGRDVDVSQQLADRLTRYRVARATEALRRGWGELPAWLFCTRTAQPFHPRVIQRAFARVLRETKLPGHFTPHSLRHSFASLLLHEGRSVIYVARQLGQRCGSLTSPFSA
jgi:integrase